MLKKVRYIFSSVGRIMDQEVVRVEDREGW
jgi:hypothetical protein